MNKNDQDHTMDRFLKEQIDTEIPPEVDARLRERLASFRERMESRDADREPWWRIAAVSRWPVPVRFAVPAAFLLLAALMFWPTSGVNNGPLAFADVLEQLREFRPYACTFTYHYDGREPFSWRVMRDSLTRRREERDDGNILVFDMSQEPNKVLALIPEKKTAIETTLIGPEPGKEPDILQTLRDMRNGTAENLGMKRVEGRLAQGFHHKPHKFNDFTIWADPETGLPVYVEVRQDVLERTLIMSDFEWDIELDESLFSTTAPEGYTVHEKLVRRGVHPIEEHLVEGLRTVATLQDGVFPSVTDFRELQQWLDGYVERIGSSASEEEIESLRTNVRLAMKYIELLKRFYEVRELRYVGDGVELGDAESPVLWWLFKALETYRVVYGDLSVRDVPPEHLPDFPVDQSSDLLQPNRGFFPYACTYTVKEEGKPDHTYRLMRWSLSRRREVHPKGTVTVVDLSQRSMIILELFPEKKRAIEITLVGGGPAKDPDMLKMANEAQYESGEDLGVQLVEGRKARGFRTLSPGNDIVFWIDEETELPLRIDNTHTGTGRKIIMSEFEWDVQFDESLFSTTVPEGYAVKRLER